MSNKLRVLDLNIVEDDVVNSTGVHMHEHDIAMHETVRNCVEYRPKRLFPSQLEKKCI